MDAKISNFIETHIELIDDNNFNELYDEAMRKLTINEVSQVTRVLLHANIDPLTHLQRIPSYYFMNLAIESIKIPAHIHTIGGGAFTNCEIFEIEFEEPSNLKCISAAAFKESTLTSIKIPDSVSIIGTQAFKGCKALEYVTLPSELESIPAGLCYDCTNLREINIPMKCERIGTNAFYNCENVKFIVPKGKKSLQIDNQTAEWFRNHAVFK